MAVFSVVAAAGVAVWGVVLLSGPQQESAADPRSSNKAGVAPFTVPTNTWRPGLGGMDAGAKGVLRFTDDDCPYMDLDKEEGTQRMWLAFPAEAIGVQDEGGMRHITDPDGRVYGTEDELLASRGGALHSDAVRNECQDAGESTFVFGIMHEPADQVIDLRPPFDPKGPSSDTAVTSPGAQ